MLLLFSALGLLEMKAVQIIYETPETRIVSLSARLSRVVSLKR